MNLEITLKLVIFFQSSFRNLSRGTWGLRLEAWGLRFGALSCNNVAPLELDITRGAVFSTKMSPPWGCGNPIAFPHLWACPLADGAWDLGL
jgi:hypothetical protein